MSVERPARCTERLQLVPGVYSVVSPDGDLRLLEGLRGRSLGRSDAWKHEVLGRLSKEVTSVAELIEGLDDVHEAAAEDVRGFVGLLWSGGWLTKTLFSDGQPVYTVRPWNGPVAPNAEGTAAEGTAGEGTTGEPPALRLVLSRFTLLYRDTDHMVIEHPLGPARIEAYDERVTTVIGRLARPVEATAVAGPLPDDVLRSLLDDLQRTGLVVSAPAEPGLTAEETEFSRRQWAPHELWFHRRTRIGHPGSSITPYGRTRWADGHFDPLPARRDPYPGPSIDLHTPDLGRLRTDDPPLAAVMEDRRSTRVFDDDDPITADELGEILYRCARIRRTFESGGIEYLSAPYPSGGSVYELEFYPVVRLAAGLAPGMYHYDAHEHRLGLVRPMGPQVARLLASARAGTLERSTAQVLIVISARFGRVMWTYQEMPYSLILKHVGVFYQTLYLAASAMGLAACGIGGGDGMAFTEATGLDYATESSVGEFMLGRGLPD